MRPHAIDADTDTDNGTGKDTDTGTDIIYTQPKISEFGEPP